MRGRALLLLHAKVILVLIWTYQKRFRLEFQRNVWILQISVLIYDIKYYSSFKRSLKWSQIIRSKCGRVQSRFTKRNRVKICSPVTNPNPEQISARQLAELAGWVNCTGHGGCRAQSRKANSCCSLIWVKIVWVFSLAHGFRGDWQLGQTKSFHWLSSQAASASI